MGDRTGESESAAADAAGGSDTTAPYPDDAQSPVARWRRREILARLDPRQTTLSEWAGQRLAPTGGTTVRERAVRVVLSPQVVVGVGLVVDLVFRVLVDIGPVTVALSELLAPIVSLSAGTVTPAVVGRVTTWLVLLGVSYAVAPRLFPRAIRSKLDTLGFRLLFVGLVAGFGLVVGRGIGAVGRTVGALLGLVGGIVATAVYFRQRSDWNLLHPDGEGTAFFDAVVREDVVAERQVDWRRTGLVGVFADTAHIVAVGLLVCIPAFVAGMLVVGFLDAQPLPDLLAVGVLGYGLSGLRPGSPRLVTADFEQRVLSNAREATRTVKGGMLSLILTAGAATTALVLSAVSSNVVGLVQLTVQAITAGRAGTPEAFGTAWVAVGAVVCSLTGAFQLLWVWERLCRRLRPFLAAWRGADEVPKMPVARPPGWLFPGFLALGTATGCIVLLDARPLPAVGWLWPGGLLPAVLAPVVARRRDSSLDGGVPETENWYLVVTASSQPVLTVAGAWAVVRVATGRSFTLAAVDGTVWSLLAVSTLLPVLAYFPDVGRYAERHDGVRHYSHAVYLAATGLWSAVLGSQTAVSLPVTLRGLGVFCLAGAAVMAVVRFVESERDRESTETTGDES